MDKEWQAFLKKAREIKNDPRLSEEQKVEITFLFIPKPKSNTARKSVGTRVM